jgi:ribose transport system substrate-binding protein
MEVVLNRLSRNRSARMLISGFNDLTAVGALQAVRAAGREKDVAVVGQNATEEGRPEIRNPSSRFIASIAYFPEQYGPKMLRLALSVLHHEAVPPAVFTQHVVIDRTNIHHYYPLGSG